MIMTVLSRAEMKLLTITQKAEKNSKIANLDFPVEVGRHYLELAQIPNMVKIFKVILMNDGPNTTLEWLCPMLLGSK